MPDTGSRLYFEDFSPGQRFALGPMVLTQEAVVGFAAAFDPQPFHLDAAAAARSPLKVLSASGWHCCSLMMRMMADAFVSRSAFMGSSSLDEMRWIRPVPANSVLRGETEITATRISRSMPDRGILGFKSRLWADETETSEMRGIFFVRVRSS